MLDDSSMRIEICGGIASGKTTLCSLVSKGGYGAFESFKENPFWSAFYREPKFHAFETEITFLLQHYSQVKTAARHSKFIACDFSFFQDSAYAELNLNAKTLDAFKAVHRQVMEELLLPSIVIHLVCGFGEELARIRRRARAEERTIEVTYLEALNNAIANSIKEIGNSVPVVTIDSEKYDFASDAACQEHVLLLIREALPAR